MRRTPLAEALVSARKTKGCFAKDVARQAGISPQYLSDLEQGTREPSDEVLVRLANVLDLDTDILWFCRGKLPPDILPNFTTRYNCNEHITAAFDAMRAALKGTRP